MTVALGAGCGGGDGGSPDGAPDSAADGAADAADAATDTDASTATPTDPTEIDGLVLWLRADQGIGSPGGAAGVVETWGDSSDSGNDFSQSEPNYQPQLVASAINGEPAVEFDGTDDRLTRSDTLGLAEDDDRTVILVGKLDDTTSRRAFFTQAKLGAFDDDSNAFGLEANTYNTEGERFGLYLVSQAYDSEAATNTNFNVLTLRTAGFPSYQDMEAGTTYFFNGQETSFTQTAGGVENPEFLGDTTAIGDFANHETPSGVVLDGQIAEVLVYRGALGDAEVEWLSGWLMAKYGL